MRSLLLPAEPVRSIDEYLASEWGGLAIQRAVELGQDGTIAEIERSGLRGRGGGGFPTGRKWTGVNGQSGTHRYAVANGAEGEPGTFKDRTLLRTNPYQVIEGLVIAAYAVGAAEAYIGLKASFGPEIELVTKAIQEMQQAGIARDSVMTIVHGPDEYLFGEEKALLEVIEGNPPLPRLFPPHEHGLFATAPQSGWIAHDAELGHAGLHESNPTLVNNVETLANAVPILVMGSDWFRSLGTDQSPGTVICTVVGDVVRPGVAEVELGTPLRQVLDDVGGGPRPGRSVKAVFSGVANAVVTAAGLDVPVSYEGFQSIGSGMGSAGFIVVDDTACMVEVAHQFSRFLSVESCGQCSPCKLGAGAITVDLERIQAGTATAADVDDIMRWLSRVTDGARCYLATEEQLVVSSILNAFSAEFDEHLQTARCPRPVPFTVPKLIDIADGRAVYDERQAHKRPDWTFADEDREG
ncbi:MAG: NADH-ubiquinone oxidoreductase-F iron-sulfur binding region domain-containing protein [Ilumatobacteraceae bacterium]|jgi:NADH:ubiquinone oxidoreductase subunit F (NADH-binding)